MSGWLNNLKNLQGQLSELASEVLNEATEEVADPGSELQVIRKRCTELEEQLKEAEAKRHSAENQKGEMEEQLRSTHYEMDAIGSRYGNLIAARDDEIKKLKVEVEQARASLHEDDVMDDEMREERIDNLKNEVAHWKALVVQGGPNANLEQLHRQKDQEMAALIQMHEDKVAEIREHYEERLAMHTSAAASGSESSEAMLDAVLLEKEELIEEKRKLEIELARRKDSSERAVLVDMGEREEGTTNARLREAEDEISRLRDQIDAFSVKETELEQLRLVNNELTAAYNDLNGELEVLKAREGRAANSNRDLLIRIDALKADVIEYEERYEMCKRENAETLKQLEKLTADFDRLRKGIDETKYRAEKSDNELSGEVVKLRDALEQSKEDRDRLRNDVDKFKNSIDSIDAELQLLRDANNRLTDENTNLSGQLDSYGGSMSKVIERSEHDLNAFREEFAQMLKDKEAEYEEREKELRGIIDDIMNDNIELKERLQSSTPLDTVESTPTKHEAIPSTSAAYTGEEKEGDDSISSRLEAQLTEALCANTEITDENERLRQDKEDLEKDLAMRQSCIDEMVQQSSLLQQQQQMTAQTIQALRKEVVDKEKELREAEVRAVHDSESIVLLETELDMLKMKITESVVREAAAKGAEVDGEKEKREMEMEREEMKRRMEEVMKEMDEKRREIEEWKKAEEEQKRREDTESRLSSLPSLDRLSSLEEEVNQLKTIAMQKHEESLAYYGQLQTSSAEILRLQSLVDNSAGQSNALKNELERRERLEKEVMRLKEHMIMVEEQTVIEAREAEERETRLLDKVRLLEVSQSATLTNAETTTQSTQARISALELSLRGAESDARESRDKLERTERERDEAAKALDSLQGVVRDLANESDRDSAHASHLSMQLREQLKDAQSLVDELRGDCEKLSLDRQAAEDAAVMAREMMERKERVVEELEIRLEEAHSAASAKANVSASQYRIDDGTLRQLFLSYFLSPIDRRADIALLLASILEYQPDEMEKVKTAINSSIGKGSNKAIGGGGGSITEQFIRFLETESESSRTAPQLPVRTERNVMRPEEIWNTSSHSIESSSSLLRDILNPINPPPPPTVPTVTPTVPLMTIPESTTVSSPSSTSEPATNPSIPQ
ncbi:hypothetical protein PFISCL1PPCAC_10485 [Pristionchus fissidentatus]|uniref:GRIP domain-containing protein n=1 Tax=Pristionchus fissidentatus TaxID=1538716 RepID=A0AAV5VIM9_9BILA|nr:hypothetical protein PFISCL1PPCAC_10485 [Pristionchus fissidentatus]